jgi:hypothetical protein
MTELLELSAVAAFAAFVAFVMVPVESKSGPIVAPFTRPKNPVVVDQKSPLTGLVGAAPWGKFRPAEPVAEAAVVNKELIVNEPAIVDKPVPRTSRLYLTLKFEFTVVINFTLH